MAEGVERYIAVLKELIARSGLTQREIERRSGWAKSSLTKLLLGHWDLKVRQLLAILKAIEVAPPVFFHLVYEKRPITDRLLEELGGRPEPESMALPPAMSTEELDRRIEEAVERVLRLREELSEPSE